MINPDQPPESLLQLIRYFSGDKDIDIFIYELGRKIQPVQLQQFEHFEACKIAWPYPFLRSAWFALAFKHKQGDKDMAIWFLRLPLDEQAKLQLASRDSFIEHFIHQILDRQSHNKQHSTDIDSNKLTQESEFGFKPSDEKMANLHAMLNYRLQYLPSAYYQDVLEYLYQPKQKDWQQLGYQGFADLACRLDADYQQKNIARQLAEQLQVLPIEVINALSTCLEHHLLPQHLSRELVLLALDNAENAQYSIACLRAISASSHDDMEQLLKKCLQSPHRNNIELLAIICGRCWQELTQPWAMQLFLEALAQTPENSKAFDIMVADLLFIPGMREHVLLQFRNPERSEALTLAIGRFYKYQGVEVK